MTVHNKLPYLPEYEMRIFCNSASDKWRNLKVANVIEIFSLKLRIVKG
jgi:hypothetical protein